VSRSYARTSSGVATPGGLAATLLIGLLAFHWPRCKLLGGSSGPAEERELAPASGAAPTSESIQSTAPREEVAPARIAPGTAPTAPTAPTAAKPKRPPRRLSDDIVVRALDRMQPAFLRCFKRLQDADLSVGSLKVNIHLEMDAAGAFTLVQNDATDAALNTCITRVAGKLPLPVPWEPVYADIPLLFR